MADVVVRDAARTDAPDHLLDWAECGWVPSCTPEDIGVTASGVRVLRFILVRATHGASLPAVPCVPPWRPDRYASRRAVSVG